MMDLVSKESIQSTPLINLKRNENGSKKECDTYKWMEFYTRLVCSTIAEFIGTALLVFSGTISFINFVGTDSFVLPSVALAYGFSFAGLSGAMQNISGGHLNPAITLGVFIAGGLDIISSLSFISAQVLGGILGSSACLLAICVETALTMMLVLVFINTSMEKKELQSTSPALCGLTLAAGILAGYRLTGGSMNPARSFGPAVLAGISSLWEYHYVYWIGPLLGGTLAGGCYRIFLSSKSLFILCLNKSKCREQSVQRELEK